MAELIEVPPGLANVAVATTEVGDVLGDAGTYHYRGRSAPDLARTASFEDAVRLILDEPDVSLSDRNLPPATAALTGQLDLRSALSALCHELAPEPLQDLDPAGRPDLLGRVIGAFGTLVASVRHGRALEPEPRLGHVADFGRMMSPDGETELSAEQRAALEAFFVLTIDHGFSNATFSTRVVASTGADLGACLLAGWSSLSGPRHGAALERMLEMFDAIAEAGDAVAWMQSEVAARRRIQGFGHSVYRTPDPRLELMREMGAIIAPERHEVAMAAERAGAEVLAGRRLAPNVDLHSAVVLEGCGIRRGWATATFAAARVAGWCAHAVEQAADAKILRPAAYYVGPPPDVPGY